MALFVKVQLQGDVNGVFQYFWLADEQFILRSVLTQAVDERGDQEGIYTVRKVSVSSETAKGADIADNIAGLADRNEPQLGVPFLTGVTERGPRRVTEVGEFR